MPQDQRAGAPSGLVGGYSHIGHQLSWSNPFCGRNYSPLAKQKILFHCDNEAVVEIWCKGSARDPETMALVRLLYFCAARYDINVVITHISSIDNCIADSLSRFQQHGFQVLAPGAQPGPDPTRAWPTPSFLHHSGNSSILE